MRARGDDVEHSSNGWFIIISTKRLQILDMTGEKRVRCVNAEIICAVTLPTGLEKHVG